ncbi:MAG: Mercuric reductase [Alphaproteobacteria bacterium MarineAlpha2_Bin1]|nr:MAG: Mercuric reductase [Alphaproteobacteria bacterium MarineAlpha2_Bin1]
MAEILKTDVCVIGAGSAGLVVAAGAALFGLNVILIERDLMGGDCLNYGCVPSKALIYAGKLKEKLSMIDKIGLSVDIPETNFFHIKSYIESVIKSIEPNDSKERFEGMGVKVIKGSAKFINKKQLQINNQKIISKKFVICSGSKPYIPDIQGLDSVPFFTNETIFSNSEKPYHLIIIGAGAIGTEIAQAYNNLSVKVSLIDSKIFLNGKDFELSNILKSKILSQGINIYENIKIKKITRVNEKKFNIFLDQDGTEIILDFSHLLLATGRVANFNDLDLKKAGIKYTKSGISVNSRLRTSNKRIYSAGDVIGQNMFTHSASYEAGIVLRNMLFKIPAKASSNIPDIIYTSPEYASIGFSEEEAVKYNSSINILRWPLSENDRAVIESEEVGLIKIITQKNGRILGVKILSPNAADLIVPWILAMNKNLKISSMANLIIPYPTLSELTKRASSNFFLPKLTSKFLQNLVKILIKI